MGTGIFASSAGFYIHDHLDNTAAMVSWTGTILERYEYDYENRIVKITKDGNDIAEFAYDALGRRIRKIDSVAGDTTYYYNNYKWQVLYETGDTGIKIFVYGNYIDEVLFRTPFFYYVHDHLYSPVATVLSNGTIYERYEYDAYGEPTIWNADFSSEKSTTSNPYLFTGRRADYLDSGSLKIQYNRNRYYDYYTGRWLTHDPLDFVDGLNRYEYVKSNPTIGLDPWGMALFKDLLDDEYHRSTTAPRDGDWEYGKWDRAGITESIRPTLSKYYARAYFLATGAFIVGFIPGNSWISQQDAAANLLHYLHNTGRTKSIDYTKMIRDSERPKKHLVGDLNNAMTNAERLALYDGSATSIVQKGHTPHSVSQSDSQNWHNAINKYFTWGLGTVRKGRGRKRCCYYMAWTSHLRDNYEFANKNIPVACGVVYDSWMYDLNKYGVAQHFKIRGKKYINLTWIKGFRFESSDGEMLNQGRIPIFPQCQ